jgi:ubiquinone/menaquinone biosynthesis C-methylase UbiE
MSGIVTDSSGWRAVDDDAAEVARYLETATRLLAVMKRKSIDMLKLSNGASVLDVGCGLGHDAEAILAETGGKGRVVGIDASKELIAKAIDRTQLLTHRPEFKVGDALALEFDGNTFDACRIDRVLQHLNAPAQAVAEMVRVTRPQGRVSALDADWHTLSVAGGDIAVAQAVTRQRAFVASSQGDIGRRLVQLLMDAGCEDVGVEAEVSVLRDLGTANFVLHIRSTLEAAISDGAITRDAGEQWWEAVQELDGRGQFFASCNIVICGATVR